MEIYKLIAGAFAFLGAVLILLSTTIAVSIKTVVTKKMQAAWIAVISLMIFFVIGYLFYISTLFIEHLFSHELLIAIIFLGGACFVYIMTNITLRSVKDLEAGSKSLRSLNEELEEDIAARLKAEQELKSSTEMALNEKAKSESIIAGMGVGLILQDLDYRIIYENDFQIQHYGSHIGEYCYTAFEQMDRICENCPMELSIRNGGVHKYYKSFPEDDVMLHIELVTSPLRDASGQVVGGIKIVKDITDIKVLEEQLRHAQKMEAIGTLTAGVAHEFNNILTSIIGFGEFLQESLPSGDERCNYVDLIVSAANRAAKLTDGMLAYSRKKITHIERLDVREVLSKAQEFLSNIVGKNINLSVEVPTVQLPVLADRSQLEQIVLNLTTNAADSMPKGGLLTIKGEAIHFDAPTSVEEVLLPPGSYVRITVSDTGEGIASEVKQKIFEPFFTTKDIGKGTGLGLAMVYGIVKRHEGFITVRSEPGKGTDMIIFLPFAVEIPAREETVDVTFPASGSETVLLAEDDPGVRSLIQTTLQKAGYTVLLATDGEDAVNRFLENRDDVDLLLFDISMPRRNGLSALEAVRNERPAIKALFVSGHLRNDERIRTVIDMGYPLIFKPLSPKALLVKVRATLDE